jgi:hypothetical protein
LKELEQENGKLKRLVVELSPDTQILQGIASRSRRMTDRSIAEILVNWRRL